MTRRVPFFALFDGADPNASVAERDRTHTPTQALFFMNGPLLHEQASKLAAQARKERDPAAALVRTALQRPARSDEAAALAELAAEVGKEARDPAAGWAAAARTLLGGNEALHVD